MAPGDNESWPCKHEASVATTTLEVKPEDHYVGIYQTYGVATQVFVAVQRSGGSKGKIGAVQRHESDP